MLADALECASVTQGLEVPTPPSPGRVVAERIRALRTAHGWSAQRLADAVFALGVPWSRSVVANVESGRRPDVTVDELFAVAQALRVSPVALMLPDEETAVAVTPTMHVDAAEVLGALTGGGEVSGLPRWTDRVIAQWRALERVQEATSRVLDLDLEAADPRTEDEERVYQAERVQARADLREARRVASELGAQDAPRMTLRLR